MNLHTAGEKADWDLINPAKHNSWQKLAAASHGSLTPSNFISIAGLILVVAGLFDISNGSYFSGSLFIAIGRSFDLLDGYIANLTKTKSPLGEMIDSTVDKIEIFIALIAITIAGIMPIWVVSVMIFLSIWVSLVSLIARYRRVDLHPSLAGKLATAAIWASLILFLFSNAFDHQKNIISLTAYVIFVMFIWLGTYSAIKYSRSAIQSQPKISPLIKEFGSFAVILNPKSSNIRRTLGRINRLKKMLPLKLSTIRTSKITTKLHKEIHEYLNSTSGKTLLFVGGGDGTMHEVLNSVLNSKYTEKIVILPIWGGNANDFAYMLNGASYRRKLAKVLKKGQIVKVKPLKISIQNKGKTTVRYAACYASFGASAFAANQLNSRLPVKKNWLFSTPAALTLQEIWSVTDAFKKAPVFSAEVSGQKVTLFEEAFMNGSRIAKINTIPLKLTDNAYYHAHQPNKHPLMSRRVIQALTGKKFGKVTSKPTSLTFNEPVIGQLDGEVIQIEKNSKVTVSLSPQAIQTISIKL